jgi:hypothetical protein
MMREAVMLLLLLERSRWAGWVAHARLLARSYLQGTQQATLQAMPTSEGLLTGVWRLGRHPWLLTTCSPHSCTLRGLLCAGLSSRRRSTAAVTSQGSLAAWRE